MIANSRYESLGACRSAARLQGCRVLGGRSLARQRRGVLLVIVLAILAAFGLVALAFVIVTSQSNLTARVDQQADQTYEPPENVADQAIHLLLRGTNDPASAIAGTSLLEDMYGDGSLSGNVTYRDLAPAAPIAASNAEYWATKPTLVFDSTVTNQRVGGQVFEFTIGIQMLDAGGTLVNVSAPDLVGRVITFTSGSCAGVTSRIVGYRQATVPGNPLYWDPPPSIPANTQPIWRLQVVSEGILPLGPDGLPGRPGFDDDADSPTCIDELEEFAYPILGSMLRRGPHDDFGIGDTFVINGAQFAGTGAGYNPATGKLDFQLVVPIPTPPPNGPLQPQPFPMALLPRPFASERDRFDLGNLLGNANLAQYRPSANEDYDGVDYQNMPLAMMLGTGQVIIPSFHRQDLCKYWVKQLISGADLTLPASFQALPPALRRKIVLRPLPYPDDHPAFTGSNSNFNPLWDGVTAGQWQWDVDNDGDGIPDGLWLDLGLPARSMADGRRYKPLVSFLIVDAEGRFNVNAHGVTTQVQWDASVPWDYYNTAFNGVNVQTPYSKPPYVPPYIPGGQFLFGNATPLSATPPILGGTPIANLPRGLGFGPSEVNLGYLWGDPPTPANVAFNGPYYNLLNTRYRNVAAANDVTAGFPGVDDALHMSMWWNYALSLPNLATYWQLTMAGTPTADVPTAWGSPPNRLGDGAIGIDPAGQPIFSRMGLAGVPDERINDPYRLNLTHSGTTGAYQPTDPDQPFTVAEWERVLRPFDRDASRLPPRLANLLATVVNATLTPDFNKTRSLTATESWSVPCPAFSPPADVLKTIRDDLVILTTANQSVSDLSELAMGGSIDRLFLARLYYELRKVTPAATAQAVQNALGTARGNHLNAARTAGMIPTDLAMRLPFDINRPFVVQSGVLGLLERQQYAKQLYLLALLTLNLDQMDLVNTQYGAVGAGARKATVRQIAQWAANVIDFRDRDSIMTYFPYDPEPFGNHPPQWSPAAGDAVWGCERPELLIHETLASHDRRTEDLSNPGGKTALPGQGGDPDFDQRKKPQGSLFIELKNPWSGLQPQPFEFDSAASRGINLGAKTTDGTLAPVWRMTIVLNDGKSPNAIFTDPDAATAPPVVYRSIYFADPVSLNQYGPSGKTVFYPTSANLDPIGPGDYAVVGPPGNNANDLRTYLGRTVDPADDGETGALRLADPIAGSDLQRVDMTSGAVGSALAKNPNDPGSKVRTVQKIVIDKCYQTTTPPNPPTNDPPRMSLSEPDAGYLAYPTNPAKTYYDPLPTDKPFDYERNDEPTVDRAILYNGMGSEGFRIAVVHLQRLADPSLAYNATTNPYRTIDSSPIDLFAFNGWEDDTSEETRPNRSGAGTNLLPGGKNCYSTYQRGKYNDATFKAQLSPNNSWVQYVKEDDKFDDPTYNPVSDPIPPPPQPLTDKAPRFKFWVGHTLGYLNKLFWTPGATAWRETAPYQGEPWVSPLDPNVPGDTNHPPFPWLVWNNRPYINAMELMLVPNAASSTLLNLNLHRNGANLLTYNEFQGVFSMANLPTGLDAYKSELGPFRHLGNFFCANQDSTKEGTCRHRLLELLGVPSPFLGTQLIGNQASFQNPPWAFPFNRFSNYREPGKVNLNTVFDNAVYAGLCNNMSPLLVSPVPDIVASSRQGYPGAATLSAPVMDGTYPSCFANPFRTSAGARLQPPLVPPVTAIDPTPPQPGSEINATLLRAGANNVPLFAFQSNATADPAAMACDTDRNAFFRYQGLQRLQNSVTTQSNVYAVWVTVGYFEVSPWTGAPPSGVDAAHPDGLMLGAELGLDTGEVKRHRAFYILDRSIPVGFQRGQNLNVDKTILLKRYIE